MGMFSMLRLGVIAVDPLPETTLTDANARRR